MSMNVYVYYKTATTDEALVLCCIARLKSLCEMHGLNFDFLKKIGSANNSNMNNELHTWMEIYKNVSIEDPTWQQLENLVRESGLYSFVKGTRHLEMFEDVSLCV